MPRISQDQTQERHAFLLDLFRSQPDVSRQEALDAFKEKFGSTINLKTLTELRDQAQAQQGSGAAEEPSEDEENETSAEDSASRLRAAANGSESGSAGTPSSQKAAKPAKGGKQKNVFVDASKEQLDFLQRIVGQLQEAGASNIRVDHATDRWMVVVVDAK